jgi:hypothetical protein
MHRIDTDGHVSNQFDEGDPGVPRNPTQIDKHWLNAVQEEVANTIEDSNAGPLVKGTNTQLFNAIAVKGMVRVEFDGAGNTTVYDPMNVIGSVVTGGFTLGVLEVPWTTEFADPPVVTTSVLGAAAAEPDVIETIGQFTVRDYAGATVNLTTWAGQVHIIIAGRY